MAEFPGERSNLAGRLGRARRKSIDSTDFGSARRQVVVS